ncbi:MAG TPA: energy transducer TonB [Thermoanaerobaculia bacterium]
MRTLHVPVLACVVLALGAQGCARSDSKIEQIRQAFQRRERQQIALCEKKRSLPPEPLRSEPLRIDDWTKSKVQSPFPIRTLSEPLLSRDPVGKLVMEVLIDEDGCARQAKVLQSPRPDLNTAAVESFSHGVFLPATLNHRPVSVIETLTIDFPPEEPGVFRDHVVYDEDP